MTIKAILFDKDGTLLDFDATFAPATVKVLLELAGSDEALASKMGVAVGFDLKTQRIAPDAVLIAGSVENIVEELLPFSNGTDPEAYCDRIDALYIRHSAETVVAFDFLKPTLVQLAAMGLPLGVATNDSENGALSHLNQLDVSGYFKSIVGFDSGHGEKPGPGMVEAFIAQQGVAPENVMMVGDSIHDLAAGNAAGAVSVGVTCGHAPQEELAPHADHVLPDISHLPTLVAELNGTAS